MSKPTIPNSLREISGLKLFRVVVTLAAVLTFLVQDLLADPSVKSQKPDQEQKTGYLNTWLPKNIREKLSIGGSIEIEAAYQIESPDQGGDQSRRTFNFSALDLDLEYTVTRYMSAHAKFEYVDGERTHVDEAVISFHTDKMPAVENALPFIWFLRAGKMAIPFGRYENHLISDPLIQELGETKEKAFTGGIAGKGFVFSIGAFSGDIDEANDRGLVHSFAGSGQITIEDRFVRGLDIQAGASYLSNVSDSDELTGFVMDTFKKKQLETHVPAAAGFLSLDYNGHLFLDMEVVASLDSYREDHRLKPVAWNMEFAFRPVEKLELGLRFGKSKNSLDFLPETQTGIGSEYEILKNLFWGIEYLYERYENNDESMGVSTLMTLEF